MREENSGQLKHVFLPMTISLDVAVFASMLAFAVPGSTDALQVMGRVSVSTPSLIARSRFGVHEQDPAQLALNKVGSGFPRSPRCICTSTLLHSRVQAGQTTVRLGLRDFFGEIEDLKPNDLRAEEEVSLSISTGSYIRLESFAALIVEFSPSGEPVDVCEYRKAQY